MNAIQHVRVKIFASEAAVDLGDAIPVFHRWIQDRVCPEMLIDVAVPYAPGDQAIFVPAQIAYVQELPEQNTYRCGVMYLRRSAR